MAKKKTTIVYTSGSWDLFHIGHLNILERSKALGDYLIVGVSTEKLIVDYKGVPPVIPIEERMRIVGALRCVNKVIRQTILTDVAQLKKYDVDIVTIGDDWKGKYLEGLEWIKAQPGKKVVYFNYTQGVSTTGIKRKIIKNTYEIIAGEFQREAKNMEQWKTRQTRKTQR
jgi:glycerol-3-phosphate cytidylyltransferase